VKELERLSQETATDKLLDSLERELREWAPEEESEEGQEEIIDRLNRDLVAKSVFREGLDLGFHEDVGNLRPIESEVRRGLEELKKLIELGKSPGSR
jgi:hypothetical protein